MFWLTRTMSIPTVLPSAKHTATVIFLHGLGDTGHGWLAGLEGIKLPYVKYMCPNAPRAKVTLNFGMEMPSWFDIRSLKKGSDDEDEEGIKASSQRVVSLIEEEINSGIPSNRILIGGFSQGGSVALHTLQTYDKKLAGCIGLSTYLSLYKQFDKLTKGVNKETTVFLGHGNADNVVSYDFGKMSSQMLSKFYKNLEFKTYNGLAHSSSPQEFSDVANFISKVLPTV